ncbi:MAG: hypothetical protein EA401_01395 [Planctomycetota bacterium]|nr:MAG: hypothetical protein EA401_01395 [Planctomycetota bacterium]
MTISAPAMSASETLARAFLYRIDKWQLIPRRSGSREFVQCFSFGPQVTVEDIDHARAFAEGLRQRYGNWLEVRQRQATVIFGMSKKHAA